MRGQEPITMKKLFFVLAATSPLFALACSSAPADSTASNDEASKVNVYACTVDSDCVAISAGGCCPNGTEVAVNKHHIKAYENAHECTDPPHICPLYVIHETRVAQCNNTTSKCEMIQPADIHCGGFMRNAHSCPSGYSCDFEGHVPDVPGICKQSCFETQECLTTEHWDNNACACVAN
jgi:hypothetical protein